MTETRAKAQAKDKDEAIGAKFTAMKEELESDVVKILSKNNQDIQDRLEAKFTEILNRQHENTKELLDANKNRFEKQITDRFEGQIAEVYNAIHLLAINQGNLSQSEFGQSSNPPAILANPPAPALLGHPQEPRAVRFTSQDLGVVQPRSEVPPAILASPPAPALLGQPQEPRAVRFNTPDLGIAQPRSDVQPLRPEDLHGLRPRPTMEEIRETRPRPNLAPFPLPLLRSERTSIRGDFDPLIQQPPPMRHGDSGAGNYAGVTGPLPLREIAHPRIRGDFDPLAQQQAPRRYGGDFDPLAQQLAPRMYGENGAGNYAGVTRLAKLEFPRFDGVQIQDWIFKAEQFFTIDATPDHLKVSISSIHFDGRAATWHQSMLQLDPGVVHDWEIYMILVMERFGEVLEDPIAELKLLQETDDITSYHDKFEQIKTKLNLPEAYLVSAYLAGLRNDT